MIMSACFSIPLLCVSLLNSADGDHRGWGAEGSPDFDLGDTKTSNKVLLTLTLSEFRLINNDFLAKTAKIKYHKMDGLDKCLFLTILAVECLG